MRLFAFRQPGGYRLAALVLLCLEAVASASPRPTDHRLLLAKLVVEKKLPSPVRTRPGLRKFVAKAESALAEPRAQKALWGILIVDEDTGDTLYELNANRFFTPASNVKLFTAALAMATLGPDFRFRTTIESRGPVDAEGKLEGDLILVGRGDPDLSNRKFPFVGKVERDGPPDKILAEMADAVVARGVKEIAGDVVADDSYFPYDPYPAGWSVGDLYFTFGAPVSAIALNDNTISVEVRPGAHVGDPASLTIEPWPGYETFGHEISTGESDSKPKFSVVREPGAKWILLRGVIPLGGAPTKLELAMDDPAECAAQVLRELLEARGVRIFGQARAVHGAPPEREANPDPVSYPIPVHPPVVAQAGSEPLVLAEHLSQPLLESIRVMNKLSQNLHAEILLRAVAREKAGIGTIDAGLQVEQEFLKSVGIADGDAVLADGSGLSRESLVTPRAVVTLLQFVARQPWAGAFISTLPVAGEDGTLENRMRGTPAAGRIRAKTGALEHVHAMSGYATTLRGAHLVFAIFGNNDPRKAQDAATVFDALTTAMVEEIGPARKR